MFSRVKTSSPPTEVVDSEKRRLDHMERGLLICVAYACNVGGTGTLTGTSPNLVVKKEADT